MRLVSHKPFLLATLLTLFEGEDMFMLQSQKRVLWIAHIHHFPELLHFLPLQSSSLYPPAAQPFSSHVIYFTTNKVFVLAGIGHRELQRNKTTCRESPAPSLGPLSVASG